MLGSGPVDPGLLTDLLADPHGLPPGLSHVRLRRVCVDRHGQVVATDRTSSPLPGCASPDARPHPDLLTDLPAPPRTTDAYRPTTDQTRVVRARDTTCTFPRCTRPAATCDLDHRHPHPDGPTSTANLHPLCRHHHRLKHDGFTCTRDERGRTRWTSPRGQHATTGPP